METGRSGNDKRDHILTADILKTGIFGGTLDPIHLGHLRTAEEIREAFSLNEIWFIPASCPPHKDLHGITPFHHRLCMAELAADGNEYFRVMDIESRRPGPSYSIDTLRELDRRYAASRKFFFIMGSDAFLEVEQWKEYRGLVDFCSIIIMSRDNAGRSDAEAVISRAWPGYRRTKPGCFTGPAGRKIIFHRVTRLEISATGIREKAGRGMSVRYLVPEKVREYMETNRLYAEEHQETEKKDTAHLSGKLSAPDEESRRAVEIARAIDDNKGEDIVVLDIRGMSAFADFFVIAHGRSTRHVEGICNKIRRNLRDKKIRCRGTEGEDEAKWVLMDYGDCIVHIFYEPVRAFYDLEGLWADAPRLQWRDAAPVHAESD